MTSAEPTTLSRLTRRARHRAEGRPIDGILLVDKPAGSTSHDVVNDARRALGTRRIGHAGTLDPFATGLLVLLIGHATRLLPHLDGEPKVYDASITFGAETDTDDLTGTVTRVADLPDAALVRDAIALLTGTIAQVPPAYSAKQVGGTRAYRVARRGDSLPLQPVSVTVHGWVIRSLTSDRLEATITCGGGTYIRALARDLGRLCRSAAHLSALRRTRSGPFDVADALSLEALRAGDARPRPPIAAVPSLPTIPLSSDDVVHVRQGRAVPAAQPGQATTVALTDGNGSLVAVAERVASSWQPRVVLPNA
jgi:tRNA pseudouridine55 synthase